MRGGAPPTGLQVNIFVNKLKKKTKNIYGLKILITTLTHFK